MSQKFSSGAWLLANSAVVGAIERWLDYSAPIFLVIAFLI
jgi:hypothetical protein